VVLKKHFLLLLKTVVLLNIFCKTVYLFDEYKLLNDTTIFKDFVTL